jgi:hypothetical protein
MKTNQLGHFQGSADLSANCPTEPSFEEQLIPILVILSPEDTQGLRDWPGLGELA